MATKKAPAKKKAAKKKGYGLSPTALRIFKAEQTRLDNDAQAIMAHRMSIARNWIGNAEDREKRVAQWRAESAVVGMVTRRARSVMASMGVTASLQIKAGNEVSAATDFRNIYVRYPLFKVDPTGATLPRELYDLMGLIYHECGHIKFTVPFTAYWSSTYEADAYSGVGGTFMAWNALEDQRMELALVNYSPRIGTYLTRTVALNIQHDPAMWFLMYGRTYLPTQLTDPMRALAVVNFGETSVGKGERIIDRYMRATTTKSAKAAVTDFARFLDSIRATLPQTSDDTAHLAAARSTSMDAQEANDKLAGSAQPAEGKGNGKGQGDAKDQGDDADGAGQGQGQGDGEDGQDGDGGKGKNDTDAPGEGGNGYSKSGQGSDPADIRQAIADAISDVLDAVNEVIAQDVERMVAEANDPANGSEYPRQYQGSMMEPEQLAEAHALAAGLEQSFQVLSSIAAPAWHSHYDEGIVNVFDYKTRERGDRDFYDQWAGAEDNALDATITLMLDLSGSMSHALTDLSVMCAAVVEVCERFDITYRVFGYGAASGLLAESGWDEVPKVFGPMGGTDPSQCLQWAGDIEVTTKRHLMIFMTDGEFGEQGDLFRHAMNNGTFIGVGYDPHPESARRCAEALRRLGVPTTVASHNLMDIPRQIETFLYE